MYIKRRKKTTIFFPNCLHVSSKAAGLFPWKWRCLFLILTSRSPETNSGNYQASCYLDNAERPLPLGLVPRTSISPQRGAEELPEERKWLLPQGSWCHPPHVPSLPLGPGRKRGSDHFPCQWPLVIRSLERRFGKLSFPNVGFRDQLHDDAK